MPYSKKTVFLFNKSFRTMVHFNSLFNIRMKHSPRVYKENKLANGFLIRHFFNPNTVCPEHKKGRSHGNGLKLKRIVFSFTAARRFAA